MKKILISIPVHEQPLVIYNQLLNIQKFVPNSNVILHASADSSFEFHQEVKTIIKKLDGFVYLNPVKYHTHSASDAGFVTGLSTVHASNYKYISSLLDFDTFAINTSNDMFVRSGIEKVFETFNCTFHTSCTPVENYPYQEVISDLSDYVDIKTGEKGSQEGLSLPSYVFKEISRIILDLTHKKRKIIKAEEMYLPCLAFNLFPELYQSNSGEHYVYHNPSHNSVTRDDIHKTQYGEHGLKFAVKRVPRIINDPIRQYINNITDIKL